MSTPPPRLFKYRDDSARTEQVFTSGKVWLATPDNLNDPLECRIGQIPADWKEARIREMEDAQMSGFLMSALPSLEGKEPFYSLSYRQAKRWFNRWKQLKSREGKYASVRSFFSRHGIELSEPSALFETFEQQLAQVGVFSLSECPDNQLMWAHYSASHTGLAIGFGCEPGTKLFSREHMLQVAYDDAKPTFNAGFLNRISVMAGERGLMTRGSVSFADPTFRAALATKPVAWSYEREWRYVEESSGLFPWPGPIDTIVFGLRMPLDRRSFYSRLVKETVSPAVEFYEIVLSSRDASLTMAPWHDAD